MEELKARLALLVEQRKDLAMVVSREHRPYDQLEIEQLAKLNSAIDAVIYTVRELTPAPPSGPPVAANEDYRLQAKAFHEVQKEGYLFTMDQVGQAGRWLIATIAASQFGGLWLLIQLSGKVALDELKAPMWTLVAGLVLIFFSGLVTYWNWSVSAIAYSRRLGPGYLINRDLWPSENALDMQKINLTQKAAILLGTLSVICIPVACYFVSLAKGLIAP